MTDEPTNEEVMIYAEKIRKQGEEHSTRQLIDRCRAYDEESRRTDKLHTARLRQRKQELHIAIKHAYHDLHREPLDEIELRKYRRWLIEKRQRSQI